MKPALYTLIIASIIFLFVNAAEKSHSVFQADATTSVAEVLLQLGDDTLSHQPDFSIEGVSAEQGKNLVLTGFGKKPSGGESAKISGHFLCTSCHNVERDEPDLSKVDPQARLEYVQGKGLPYLQGSALYGIVNRTSFYNGDYEKKYGNLVEKARNNLRESIQLCATECSQGRALEPWEMESVLAYLWTIDLKLRDLNLSEKEYQNINTALKEGKKQKEAVQLIKSRYLSGAPATFVAPPENRKEGYANITGDPANGKLVYELSCLYCHENQRYAFFELNESTLSLAYLDKHFPKYTRYSTYQVARYGTSPIPGKRAYMPLYTLEKLSHQQLEDLRAYVRQGEEKKQEETTGSK